MRAPSRSRVLLPKDGYGFRPITAGRLSTGSAVPAPWWLPNLQGVVPMCKSTCPGCFRPAREPVRDLGDPGFSRFQDQRPQEVWGTVDPLPFRPAKSEDDDHVDHVVQ